MPKTCKSIVKNTHRLRAGSHYAQVERRSVTFMDQTMSRGEAFGLKKYTKITNLKNLPDFEYFNEKKVRPLDRSLGAAT